MALDPGTMLAHYRLAEKVGEGGMGEVYRARDSKLGRDVALKFLPPAFASDADRMTRFTREAQVLASLNHANIAGIHAVEEVGADASPDATPHQFLVMEMVEGETLQERIARGPLSAEEAAAIALQVAQGLEAAHERGIIHRDLKPANIKLTPDKQAKILDFGLAKAFDMGTSGGSGETSDSRLSLSPTMTAGTSQAGMLLGTAAYMSPEQARGEAVDRRADIWALGVVLMEMLTGRNVHQGNTISDTLASVLAREPEWQALPQATPRSLTALLRRCLEKDSRQRLRDVGEARIVLERFVAGEEEVETAVAADRPAESSRRSWLPWLVAAVLAVATTLSVSGLLSPSPPRPRPVRTLINTPDGLPIFTGYGAGSVLSHDGSKLLLNVRESNRNALHLLSLDAWETRVLHSGRAGLRAYQPFFSPDDNWVGYVTVSELLKVPVTGGSPIRLGSVNRNRGASWGPEGKIVYSPSPTSPLMQVSADGGEPEPLTTLDADSGEVSHRWPQWLPDGRGILFTVHTSTSNFNEARIEVLVTASGERRVVHRGGSYGRYAGGADGSGHLIYANGGALFAAPFDLESLQSTGSAAPVVDKVITNLDEGSAQFSISGQGHLVYKEGDYNATSHQIMWMDRDGNMSPFLTQEGLYRNPVFSPDGRFLAYEARHEGNNDIWVYDVRRDISTRLTFSASDNTFPVWSPDGQYLYYSPSDDSGRILRKLANGSGDPEVVVEDEHEVRLTSISADGRLLSVTRQTPDTASDVLVLKADDDMKPLLSLNSKAQEFVGRISPDGRWLAYATNESGSFQVYVRSLSGQGKWQVSSEGGFFSRWSAAGDALYFVAVGSVDLWKVAVDPQAPGFQAGRPELAFQDAVRDVGFGLAYAPHPDGEGFAIIRSNELDEEDDFPQVRLVLNWATELGGRTTP